MLPLQIDVDDMFDLDFALTMPETSRDKHQPDAESAARRLVDAMPDVSTVVDSQCTVCMEEFRLEENGKRIPCGHVFHEGCIFDWLSLHNSCPLCRGTVAP